MNAIIKTKSNYKNCNGKSLEIVEFLGNIIACKVPEFGFNKNGEPEGKWITSDFNIKEIVSINK